MIIWPKLKNSKIMIIIPIGENFISEKKIIQFYFKSIKNLFRNSECALVQAQRSLNMLACSKTRPIQELN